MKPFRTCCCFYIIHSLHNANYHSSSYTTRPVPESTHNMMYPTSCHKTPPAVRPPSFTKRRVYNQSNTDLHSAGSYSIDHLSMDLNNDIRYYS